MCLDLDMSRLVAPSSVRMPSVGSDEPQTFLTQEWLTATVEKVITNFRKAESSAERVPLLGVIRCNRGEKRRALKEICRALKHHMPGTAVIFVSFNISHV